MVASKAITSENFEVIEIKNDYLLKDIKVCGSCLARLKESDKSCCTFFSLFQLIKETFPHLNSGEGFLNKYKTKYFLSIWW